MDGGGTTPVPAQTDDTSQQPPVLVLETVAENRLIGLRLDESAFEEDHNSSMSKCMQADAIPAAPSIWLSPFEGLIEDAFQARQDSMRKHTILIMTISIGFCDLAAGLSGLFGDSTTFVAPPVFWISNGGVLLVSACATWHLWDRYQTGCLAMVLYVHCLWMYVRIIGYGILKFLYHTEHAYDNIGIRNTTFTMAAFLTCGPVLMAFANMPPSTIVFSTTTIAIVVGISSSSNAFTYIYILTAMTYTLSVAYLVVYRSREAFLQELRIHLIVVCKAVPESVAGGTSPRGPERQT